MTNPSGTRSGSDKESQTGWTGSACYVQFCWAEPNRGEYRPVSHAAVCRVLDQNPGSMLHMNKSSDRLLLICSKVNRVRPEEEPASETRSNNIPAESG